MRIGTIGIIFLLIFCAGSCSKSPRCWGKDKNKGDIVSEIRITCEPLSGDRWVIRDETSYKQTFPSECSLPEVDFSRYTLIGVVASGGCETKYIRHVEMEDNGGAHYEVTARSCGTCKSLATSYNWVTIPLVPSNTEVTFDVKNK